MPKLVCPNCHAKVRVEPHQLGKVLRCSKCGSRFLADPGLPPDAFVQNYSGEAPPVQIPPADGAGIAEPPAAPALPSFGHRSFDDVEAGQPASYAGGWVLFAVWVLLEFAAGFMYGFAGTYTEYSYLADRYY
ncbi:MAG TPA: MJ0042-type zinc finger domain-containing protein [Gemmataceae bacterium]|jgi:predicted Zn finger-like uncharacterized protein